MPEAPPPLEGWPDSFEELMKDLEGLAVDFLEQTTNAWSWQLNLLDLQQRTQAAIRRVKDRSTDDDSNEHLENLQHCRYHARLLGDALAWRLFAMNRPKIATLGQNSPVPVSSARDLGSQGVVASAEALMRAGWGVPLLHDITNCLRIGDVTFVLPEEPDQLKSVTVEIKSRTLSVEPISDHLANVVQDIRVYTSDDLPAQLIDHIHKEEISPPRSQAIEGRRHRIDARARRQLARMQQAKLTEQAKGKGITFVPGLGKVLLGEIEELPPRDPRLLGGLLQAKAAGYVGFRLDHATFVGIFFVPVGSSVSPTEVQPLLDDLTGSGLCAGFEDATDRTLTLHSFPGEEATHSNQAMPYFLSGLPEEVILSIMHGRLAAVFVTCRGRVRECLDEAGLRLERVVAREGRDTDVIRWTNTNSAPSREHQLRGFLSQMTYCARELRGMDLFMAKLRDMVHHVELADS